MTTTTTELDDIEHLLIGATSVEAIFGADIDREYRKLARACHPDRYRGKPQEAQAERCFRMLMDWRDKADAGLEEVKSKTHTYRLVRVVGTGDISAVYYAATGSEPYAIKIPRVANCNNLLAKEAEILRQLQEYAVGDKEVFGKYLPVLTDSFTVDRRRINAFKWVEGYASAEIIKSRFPALDPRHCAWMLRRLLEVLGYVHECGWVHGAVLPPHLLFHPTGHGVLLLDWIHAEKVGSPIKTVPAAFRDWYPADTLKRGPAGPALDIYSACRTIAWLAGWGGAGPLPKSIPARFAAFLRGCLLESPHARPQNAWEAHEELSAALKKDFGKPKYIRLDL